MSRAAKGALAFGAAVVLWRTADLFLFTDVPTGFCAGGAVWRYAAMGLCALAAWLFPLAVPRQSARARCAARHTCTVVCGLRRRMHGFWPVGAR